MKAIIFTIKGKKFGIETQFVSTIELRHSIVSIPNAPGGIRGIVDLRGNIYPVYNLAKRFGLEYDQKNEEDSQLLLCEIESEIVALEVDDVEQICEVDPTSFVQESDIVSELTRTFMKTVMEVHGKIIMLVDVEKLIPEEEKKKLNEIEQW